MKLNSKRLKTVKDSLLIISTLVVIALALDTLFFLVYYYDKWLHHTFRHNI